MRVSLMEAISLLSSTLGLVDSKLVKHHKRVAYVSAKIGATLGLSKNQIQDLIIAGLLHDIGALYQKERMDMIIFDSPSTLNHPEVGYLLLRDFVYTKEASKIILHHHMTCSNLSNYPKDVWEVPFESHIVHLADRVDVSFLPNVPILTQMKKIRASITGLSNKYFNAEVVAGFLKASESEQFWLEMYELPSYIYDEFDHIRIELTQEQVRQVAEICSFVIDFRSPFTATHSAGVGATAFELASRMGWHDDYCQMLRMAGYFHDMGKLKIPVEILEKPGSLTPEEFDIVRTHSFYSYQALSVVKDFHELRRWSSEHHEKLNGSGYPFKHKEQTISLAARIMAIADIYTALIEDRPYRVGMTAADAVALIGAMVEKGELDSEVFTVLKENRNAIAAECFRSQTRAAGKYEEIKQILRLF